MSTPENPYGQQPSEGNSNPYGQPQTDGTASPYGQPTPAADQYGQQNPTEQQPYGSYGQQPYAGYEQQPYAGYDQQQGQQPYGAYDQNQQPYGGYGQQSYVQPPTGQKSKIVAGILGILLGSIGVHNFYLGNTGKAVTQLLITVISLGMLSVISAVWGLIEGILILVSKPGDKWHRDARGFELQD